MNAKIICLDFDDTINDYPGWRNEGYAVVNGEPVEGAKESIKALRDSGHMVLVHSVRCGYTGGMVAVVEYLNKYNIRVDGVCSNKPPADIYLDDKSITFTGNWMKAIEDIEKFKQWKDQLKTEKAYEDYHRGIGYTEKDIALDKQARELAALDKDPKAVGTGEI